MDVGIVNGLPFLACVGVGWDAHVVRSLSESRSGHIRFHSYVRPMLRAAFQCPFHRLTVTTAEGATAAAARVPFLARQLIYHALTLTA